jgi:hypothetical protein
LSPVTITGTTPRHPDGSHHVREELVAEGDETDGSIRACHRDDGSAELLELLAVRARLQGEDVPGPAPAQLRINYGLSSPASGPRGT